jgi:hypothetical protein
MKVKVIRPNQAGGALFRSGRKRDVIINLFRFVIEFTGAAVYNPPAAQVRLPDQLPSPPGAIPMKRLRPAAGRGREKAAALPVAAAKRAQKTIKGL